MLPFWSCTLSQDERTHKWDVSGTDWSRFPKGVALESAPFSCGGLDGLSLRFYPQGASSFTKAVARVRLKVGNGVELMAKVKFTVEYCENERGTYATLLQHFPVSLDFVYLKPSYRTISVELVSVKKMCQQLDAQQINCAPGEMLRVTSDPDKAAESFGVVGCKIRLKFSMKKYLGEIGRVVGFDNFVVELRHADNTITNWGHGALSQLLTSDEVEAMKVQPTEHFDFHSHVLELKSHLKDRGLPTSGLKDLLIQRLKEAEKCATGMAQWAGAVLISGVAGRKEKHLNGVYQPTRDIHNGKPLFQKKDDPDKWLRFDVSQRWAISDTEFKDSNRGGGLCQSVDCYVDHPTEVKTWNVYANGAEKKWEVHDAMKCIQWSSPVLIEGVVGRKAKVLNGVYEQTRDLQNGKPLFQKQGDPDIWLRFGTGKQWLITATGNKNANNVCGWCRSMSWDVEHPRKVKKWKIYANGAEDKWERPREETRGEAASHNSPEHKKLRTIIGEYPQHQVVELFPLESSQVLVRCGQRQAGGGGEGSSTLNVQAGESFHVVVAIKSRFGAVAGGDLVEQMMKEIVILPEREVEMHDKPHFSSATGVATFTISIRKAGDLEISAAVFYKGEHCTIGGRGVVIRVGPGALKLKLLAKEEAELGEEVELVVVPDSTDVFGNTCQLPLCKSYLSNLAFNSHFEGDWSHEGACHEGQAPLPLRLMQPCLTRNEDGVLVGVLDLRLVGLHTFRIRYSNQMGLHQPTIKHLVTAQVRIVCGMPHSLRYEAFCQPHMLQHRRWGCKAQVLNTRGQEMTFNIREEDFIAKLLDSTGRSLPLKVRTSFRSELVQGCSLANQYSEGRAADLEISLIETEPPASRGTYELQACMNETTRGDGHLPFGRVALILVPLAVLVAESVQPREIRLDEPLDPATWSSQALAESLRQARFEVPGTAGDVLKDEFGAELSGRHLIGTVDEKYETLRDCLLHDRKFADREEKAFCYGRIKEYVKSLNEKHTIFGLGKGRFKSSVAKCISETDDLVLDPEPFNKGGTAEIFRGEYQGSSVAVKIPLFMKSEGLKVDDDDTLALLQEVQRELATTKDCSHQNVVQIHGLMVGPGRIGIVMEYCDMSLAKYIQNRVDTVKTVNWAEAVCFLIDASTGLAFIHNHKRTTHGDVKPDNFLIQQGRLKVSDFGLAVHHTMTKFTGQVSRKGTSYFMAPEMLLGNDSNANAPPIDVWGFGCVIANVVTGKIPFVTAKSQLELEAAMRQKKSVYLKENFLTGSPKKLVDLIDRCCQHEPRQRPNMEEIERELRDILKSIQTEDGFALPPPWLERGCSLDDSSWKMLPCDASSVDFKIIKNRLEWEMGEQVTLLKVEMNANVDLFRCYDSERHRTSQENGGDANEMWMWHATQRSKEDRILQRGFDTNFCGLDFEYYGAGIYLAPDSKLSNDYAVSSRNTEYPSNRSMLLVRVTCGKVFDKRHPLKLHRELQALLLLQTQQNLTSDQKKQQKEAKFQELLRKPENRSCPPGWHSQLGEDISGERKSRTELIINRSCQAFPAYRISYRLARALPKALSKEGQVNLRTFDDLKSSEFHRQAVTNRLL